MCDLFRSSARRMGAENASGTRPGPRAAHKMLANEETLAQEHRRRMPSRSTRSTRRDLGPLLARIGDARVVLLGEATPRHFGILSDARPHLARADREEGISLCRHRGRLAGCRARRSITSGISNIRPPNGPRLRVSRPGCGATTRCAISSTGCASTMPPLKPAARVAFHGLDLYSLYVSIRAVLDYLDEVDPTAAHVARERYGCLTPWQSDPGDLRPCGADRRLSDLRIAKSCVRSRTSWKSASHTPSVTANVSWMRCRMPGSSPTRSAIIASCIMARARPGTCATSHMFDDAEERCSHFTAPAARRSFGRTIPTLAMRRRPKWLRAASITSATLPAGIRRRCLPNRLRHQ